MQFVWQNVAPQFGCLYTSLAGFKGLILWCNLCDEILHHNLAVYDFVVQLYSLYGLN